MRAGIDEFSPEERIGRSFCCYCSTEPYPGPEICEYHFHEGIDDEWSVENRIYCDFLHRKKPWVRFPDRDEEGKKAWVNDDVYEVDEDYAELLKQMDRKLRSSFLTVQ